MSSNHIKKNLAGAVLTINLKAIVANYALLRDKAKGAQTGAVVKADAYGTGMSQVAPLLATAGCEIFFVAHVAEGIKLRNLLPNVEIHILNGLLSGAEEAYVQYSLTPVLGSIEEIHNWINFCGDSKYSCDLHIDTGMQRLGLPSYELDQLLAKADLLSLLSINLVISHLASADIEDSSQNLKQLEAYQAARRKLPMGSSSFANSAGIFMGGDFLGDVVRPGIALYGCNPTPWMSNPMHPVITLKARILQRRNAFPGSTVSYGATYTIERSAKIATVSVGYADGYIRSLSGRGVGIVNGIHLPVLGRVTMDLIMLDVSALPEEQSRPGSWVELIGEFISVDDLANAAGTIPHEVLTNLGNRYHRRYVNGLS